MLLSFTSPHVSPNMYDLLPSAEHRRHFEKYFNCFQHMTHLLLLYGGIKKKKKNFVCVAQKKVSHTVWSNMTLSKLWISIFRWIIPLTIPLLTEWNAASVLMRESMKGNQICIGYWNKACTSKFPPPYDTHGTFLNTS